MEFLIAFAHMHFFKKKITATVAHMHFFEENSSHIKVRKYTNAFYSKIVSSIA
jgi:hypothetical protein